MKSYRSFFVRGFFKDVAAIDDLGAARQPTAAMLPILMDVSAGLLMFLNGWNDLRYFAHPLALRMPFPSGRIVDKDRQEALIRKSSLD